MAILKMMMIVRCSYSSWHMVWHGAWGAGCGKRYKSQTFPCLTTDHSLWMVGWKWKYFMEFFFFCFLEDEEKRNEPLLLSLYCCYVSMMMVEKKAERDNNRQYNNNAHIVVICVLYCIHYILYALYNMQWSHPQRAHQMFTRNNVVLFYCPCLQLLSLA